MTSLQSGQRGQHLAQHIFRRNISAVAIAVRMLLAIFLPQQFDGQVAVLLKLLADVDKIGLCSQRHFRHRLARREQRLFQAVLIPFLVERPA